MRNPSARKFLSRLCCKFKYHLCKLQHIGRGDLLTAALTLIDLAGEAATDALNLQPGQACGFVSAVKEILRRFVTAHFPVSRNIRVADASAVDAVTEGSSSLLHAQAAGGGGAASGAAAAGKVIEKRVHVAECVKMRDELLAAIEAIVLPAHFLDELTDKLGGTGAVAEMTGRSSRIARVGAQVVFAMRAKLESTDMESLNMKVCPSPPPALPATMLSGL